MSRWFECKVSKPSSKIQIFLFPHGGGNTNSFDDLLSSLDDSIEGHVLSLPGRGQRFSEPHCSDMNDLISLLIEDFKIHFGKKPFFVFGHSVGAIVAFEFANRLIKTEKRTNLFLRLFISGHLPPNVGEVEYHDLSKDEMVRILKEGNIVDLGSVNNEFSITEEWIDFILPQMKSDFFLSETYELDYDSFEPLQIPCSICNGKNDELIKPNFLKKWSSLFSEKTEVKFFDGGHFYYRERLKDVIQYIIGKIKNDLSQYPISVMDGGKMEYKDLCLHEHFQKSAAKHPNELAIIEIDGKGGSGKSLTYEKVDLLSNILSQYLVYEGIEKMDLVAFYGEKSSEYVIAYLSVWKSGAGVLVLDDHPDDGFRRILEVTQPKLIITKEKQIPKLIRVFQQSNKKPIPFFVMDEDENWVSSLQEKNFTMKEEKVEVNSMDIAFSVTTSGTTGLPKAIIGTHRMLSFSHQYRNEEFKPNEGDKEAFNIFFNWEFIRPLMHGEILYIIPESLIRDPVNLIRCIGRFQFTRIMTTPTLLDRLIGVLNSNNPKINEEMRRCLNNLTLVWVNGEVLPTETWKKFQEIIPKAELVNLYSISECFDISNVRCSDMDIELSSKFSSVGRPISNVRIYVLDKLLKPVHKGMCGEVYVSGINISYGYKNNQKKTKEVFIKDTIYNNNNENNMMYKTGDVGRILSNGQLEIRGRTDFMVKIRGYRIQLEQIQTTILEYTNILASYVIPYQNNNGSSEFLIAYIVPKVFPKNKSEENKIKSELRLFLRSKLEEHAIPSYFIFLKEFPVSVVTGKIDKKKLPKFQMKKRISGTDIENSGMKKDEIKSKLIEIWKKLIIDYNNDELEENEGNNYNNNNNNIPSIDNDNFFHVGGYSLLAISMVQELDNVFNNMGITVTDIYENPTIGELCNFIYKKNEDTGGRNIMSNNLKFQGKQNIGVEKDDSIAIIGLSCVFPDAENSEVFFQNLLDNKCSIRKKNKINIDDDIGDKKENSFFVDSYTKLPINEMDFDSKFWGISQWEARNIDPQQRVFLEQCWKALEDSGYPPKKMKEEVKDRTGVFGGCYYSSYLLKHLMKKRSGDSGSVDVTDSYFKELGNDKDYITTRVSYLLDLHGPSVNVQTSCSTSLVAVAMGCSSIISGECDMCIAGGVKISVPQSEGYYCTPGHVLSPTGKCRPFDKNADGTIFTDGCGVVVLKSLKKAKRDGDNILAVIKGWAINNDGKRGKISYSSPSIDGQRKVVRRSMEMAGFRPDSLGLLEAHGTGTFVGDPVEVEALRKVFQDDFGIKKKQFCCLGSVKGNIGHSDIASGIASLIKSVYCVKRQVIPPVCGLEEENPSLRIEKSPFFLNKKVFNWSSTSHPRRAGISSFGIGGTNCHMTIEEFIDEKKKIKKIRNNEIRTDFILPVSAKSESSLLEYCNKLFEYLYRNPQIPINQLELTLQENRDQFRQNRFCVHCNSNNNNSNNETSSLSSLFKNINGNKNNKYEFQKIIFLFTGQGHQYKTMGYELYKENKYFQTCVDECLKIFSQKISKNNNNNSNFESLKTEIFNSDKNSEINNQILLFCIEYSTARLLISIGLSPDFLIGHSFGEFVAAVISGIMNLETIISFILARAESLEQLNSEIKGSMISISTDESTLEKLIFQNKKLGLVFPALVNTENQICVAGKDVDVNSFSEFLVNETNIEFKKVDVKYPFHSELLKIVSDLIMEKINHQNLKIDNNNKKKNSIPIFSNITGEILKEEDFNSWEYWSTLISTKCNFLKIMKNLFSEEISKNSETTSYVFIEIGPGRFISNILRNYISNAQQQNQENSENNNNNFFVYSTLPSKKQKMNGKKKDLELLFSSISKIWMNLPKLEFNWKYLRNNNNNRFISGVPTYQFEKNECRFDNDSDIENENNNFGKKKKKNFLRILEVKDRFFIPFWKNKYKKIIRNESEQNNNNNNNNNNDYLVILSSDEYSRNIGEKLIVENEKKNKNGNSKLVSVKYQNNKKKFDYEINKKEDISRFFKEEVFNENNNNNRTVRIISLLSISKENIQDEFTKKILVFMVQELLLSYESCKIHITQISPNLLFSSNINNRQLKYENDSDYFTNEQIGFGIVNSGYLLVMPQEFPRRIDCSIINISPSRIHFPEIDDILKETFNPHPGSFREIFLMGNPKKKKNQRRRRNNNNNQNVVLIPSFQEYPIPTVPPNIPFGGLGKKVFLLIGGLGRIGKVLTRHLLKKYKPELIIITTTRKLTQEDHMKLVSSFQEDSKINKTIRIFGNIHVEDKNALLSVFTTLEKEKIVNITGIFYLSGAYENFGVLEIHKNEENIEKEKKIFNSKIKGIQNLGDIIITKEEKLEVGFVLGFSSLSSVLGGPGFSSYVSSNRFLDHYFSMINEHEQNYSKWVSILWDEWEFEYNDDEIGDLGIGISMSSEEGMECIDRILFNLDEVPERIVISNTNLEERVQKWVVRNTISSSKKNKKKEKKEKVFLKEEEEEETEGEDQENNNNNNNQMEFLRRRELQRIYSEVLGSTSETMISIDGDFFEFGGESILASIVLRKIRNILVSKFDFSVRKSKMVKLKDIYQYSTIKKLSNFITIIGRNKMMK